MKLKSVTACTILLAFTIVSQVRNSRSKNESRMVVLAAGIFDKDGRLLVTTEGLIPHVTITKQYVEHVSLKAESLKQWMLIMLKVF